MHHQCDVDTSLGWRAQAASLDGVGAYSWMASRLYGATRVLEVGCGWGNGTLAMVVEGMKVIAVENDPNAVDATLSMLRSHGVRAEVAMSLGDGLDRSADVVIVNADFFHLLRGDVSFSALDAIVCWNAGTEVIAFGRRTDFAGEAEAASRRVEPLQRAAFGVAARMASGTTVHVVDRVSYRHEHRPQVVDAFSRRHAGLAAPAVNVVPGLTTAWPYRTTERVNEDEQRLQGSEPLAVTALVSTVGFVY